MASSILNRLALPVLGMGFGLAACGGEMQEPFHYTDYASALFAMEVVQFEPGNGAGFGMDAYPEIVFGPPKGGGNNAGSFDVLSLGQGGEIVLGFGEHTIVDEQGPDFIVFENAFWANGQRDAVWADLAEVSVSRDGMSWETFPCDSLGDGNGNYPGCAGWRPVHKFELNERFMFSHENVGGDAFDLAELSLREIKFIRIRDLSETGEAPSAGFDLDGVAAIRFN
jgi:hypothetical protein